MLWRSEDCIVVDMDNTCWLKDVITYWKTQHDLLLTSHMLKLCQCVVYVCISVSAGQQLYHILLLGRVYVQAWLGRYVWIVCAYMQMLVWAETEYS